MLGLALTSTGGARQWFLSPTGSDSNPGTNQASPFQSWSRANHVLAPGDTLTLLDGTYGIGAITVSGTANAWITVQAQHPGAAVVSLATTVAAMIPPNQYTNASYAWVWEQVRVEGV